MPIRSCPTCNQQLLFEARACDGCGRAIGFDCPADRFRSFDPALLQWQDGEGQAVAMTYCANAPLGVCNWLVEAGQSESRCAACLLNRVIPDLSVPGVLDRWRRIEDAKRRMVYGLIRLGLPIGGDARHAPPVFDLLYDAAAEKGAPPRWPTGHAGGVITLNVIEADDVARERIRRDLGEPYRTVLGHFRHEIAHYYWHRLIEHTPDLARFRELFGDETAGYQAALQRHYRDPPPAGWRERFISAYATMHPWEDFAETFAHYLHLVDTLAALTDARVRFGTRASSAGDDVPFNPYRADIAVIAEQWIPAAFALNEICRSMGHRDLYPFSLSPTVMVKLDYVHRLISFAAGRWAPGAPELADLRAAIAALAPGVQQTTDPQ